MFYKRQLFIKTFLQRMLIFKQMCIYRYNHGGRGGDAASYEIHTTIIFKILN